MQIIRNPFSFEMARTTRKLLKGSYNTKAAIYGSIAVLLSWTYALAPPAVGVYLLSQGEILRGILLPILIYIYISLFMAAWPFFFLIGWYYEGFWESLIATGGTVMVLLMPDWLMMRAMRSAEKAAMMDAEDMTYLDRGSVGPGKVEQGEPLAAPGEEDGEALASDPRQRSLFDLGGESDGLGAHQDLEEKTIIRCQNAACGGLLRVPAGRRLRITCPRCKESFIQDTSDPSPSPQRTQTKEVSAPPKTRPRMTPLFAFGFWAVAFGFSLGVVYLIGSSVGIQPSPVLMRPPSRGIPAAPAPLNAPALPSNQPQARRWEIDAEPPLPSVVVRPRNGAELIANPMKGGRGELIVVNGTANDAAVKLATLTSPPGFAGSSLCIKAKATLSSASVLVLTCSCSA